MLYLAISTLCIAFYQQDNKKGGAVFAPAWHNALAYSNKCLEPDKINLNSMFFKLNVLLCVELIIKNENHRSVSTGTKAYC